MPEVKNDPNMIDSVAASDRPYGNWNHPGVLLHAEGTAALPLFTFGKLSAYKEAAGQGVKAGEHLAEEARRQAARTAAEAFWGYQFARQAVSGADSAEKQLTEASDKVKEMLAQHSPQVTKADLSKLEILGHEIGAQRAQAVQGQATALEGARLLAGLPPEAPFALAETALAPPAIQLPPVDTLVAQALDKRPEVQAARAGVAAREDLSRAKRRELWPDLLLAASGNFNYCNVTTPKTNPFAYDPYNGRTGGIGLVVKGSLDIMGNRAQVAQADADLEHARAEASLAEKGVRLEVVKAYGAATAALARATEMAGEEAAARRWATASKLAFDSGTGEASDLFLAVLATARGHGEVLRAQYDADMALADLALATGWDLGNPQEVR
jgi:outer membrane protein TolC